jgi:hypothetical protein
MRPMSLNGYAWVEGNAVNRTDPSGSCPENPGPLDVFGWRCRFLAEGLAARTGSPVENFMWMDYGQLELLTGLGTLVDVSSGPSQFMRNSAIIQDLFRENSQVALLAIQEWGCQNSPVLAALLSSALIGSVYNPGIGGALGRQAVRGLASPLGLLIAGGTGLGLLISSLFAGTANRTRTRDDDEEQVDIAYRNPDPLRGEHPSALTEGFRPKAPDNVDRGPAFHITSGSRYPTRFISLTRSLIRARACLKTEERGGKLSG